VHGVHLSASLIIHTDRIAIPIALYVSLQCTEDRIRVVYMPSQCVVHGHRPRRGRPGGGNLPPPNFGLSEKCPKIFILSEKLRPKIQNKAPISEKVGEKLSTHNFPCRKFVGLGLYSAILSD